MERVSLEPWLVLLAALCLLPSVSAPIALVAGVAFAAGTSGILHRTAATSSKRILQVCIVGLGFGVGGQALSIGPTAIWATGASVVIVLGASLGLARMLGVHRHLGWLNASGAAICGGSAIATISTTIEANRRDIAVALALVFAMNGAAVLAFPSIGGLLGLSQTQFGVWAALAIHDTASVAAAAGDYGPQALDTATVWKLSRALWIAPLAVLAGIRFETKGRFRVPWFIWGFLAAAALSALMGDMPVFDGASTLARRGLVAAIFLVGASWFPGMMQGVQKRAVLQAGGIWILLAVTSLAAVLLWM